MSQKQPNKYLAPIVIAGVTFGFLASAYKFVFAKSKKQPKEQHEFESQSDLLSEPTENKSENES